MVYTCEQSNQIISISIYSCDNNGSRALIEFSTIKNDYTFRLIHHVAIKWHYRHTYSCILDIWYLMLLVYPQRNEAWFKMLFVDVVHLHSPGVPVSGIYPDTHVRPAATSPRSVSGSDHQQCLPVYPPLPKTHPLTVLVHVAKGIGSFIWTLIWVIIVTLDIIGWICRYTLSYPRGRYI